MQLKDQTDNNLTASVKDQSMWGEGSAGGEWTSVSPCAVWGMVRFSVGGASSSPSPSSAPLPATQRRRITTYWELTKMQLLKRSRQHILRNQRRYIQIWIPTSQSYTKPFKRSMRHTEFLGTDQKGKLMTGRVDHHRLCIIREITAIHPSITLKHPLVSDTLWSMKICLIMPEVTMGQTRTPDTHKSSLG